jgi:hypothetical protein
MTTLSKWLMAVVVLSGPVVANAQKYTVTDLGAPIRGGQRRERY